MADTISQRPTSRRSASGFFVAAEQRPVTERWEDAVTMGLSVFTLFALFWDGWLHNNSITLDSFWSSAHIAMYTGLTSLGVWVGVVFVKRQPRGKKLVLNMSAVPYGYGLALIALPLAAIGGPGDFAWHAAYGFENQVDAPFSPTHQMLFLAGALLGGIGLGSTWYRKDGRRPSMRLLWPAVISLSAIVAVIEFTFMNLLPYFWVMVPTTDFQHDIRSNLFIDAYKPGSGVKHVQGLADSAAHYGDHAFNYYLFSQHADHRRDHDLHGGVRRGDHVLPPPLGAAVRGDHADVHAAQPAVPVLHALPVPGDDPRADHHRPAVDLLARWLVNVDPPSVLRLRLFAALDPTVHLDALGARDRALPRHRLGADGVHRRDHHVLRRRLRHLAARHAAEAARCGDRAPDGVSPLCDDEADAAKPPAPR